MTASTDAPRRGVTLDHLAARSTMASIKGLAYRGATWTALGYGASQGLRLLSSVILTRLLLPDAFGLMGLIYVLLQGLQLFSDVGIGPSIIQNRRGDDPAFLDTAWTIQAARGFALAGVACLIAWPFARFYGEPQIGWLLPAAGLGVLIAGFNSTALFTFRRHLEVGKVTALALASQVVGLVGTTAYAWATGSVWALVVGSWMAALSQMALSHAINPIGRNRFRLEREAVGDLLRFGRWIFLSTALSFLAIQSDRLILGKLVPLQLLGVYAIAHAIAEIPRTLLVNVTSSVIIPAVSRRADLARDELRARILKARGPVLLGMAVVVAILVGFGDHLILTLYDPRFADAAWILPVLALGLWPRVLDQTISGSLVGIGQLHYNPAGSALRLALVGLGMYPAYRTFGLLGAVVVVALADIPNYASHAFGLWRHGLSGFRQDLGATAVLIVALAVVVGLREAAGMGPPIVASSRPEVNVSPPARSPGIMSAIPSNPK